MMQVKSFMSVIDFEWFLTIGVVGTTNFFGILRFLPIAKDREQLRTANKNYLVIKANKHTREYSCHAMTPRQRRQKKVLITHKYRGSIVAF